jgi:hypothetical protein
MKTITIRSRILAYLVKYWKATLCVLSVIVFVSWLLTGMPIDLLPLVLQAALTVSLFTLTTILLPHSVITWRGVELNLTKFDFFLLDLVQVSFSIFMCGILLTYWLHFGEALVDPWFGQFTKQSWALTAAALGSFWYCISGVYVFFFDKDKKTYEEYKKHLYKKSVKSLFG